uniref:C2H2-type domain-containing protein n=1 Tax=Panagrolaimus sp. ES5 TaxID=591445 RepID=A0AC34G0M3_9BILA
MRDLVSIAKTRMTETPSTASVARKREVEDDVVKVETYVDKLEEYRKHVIKSVYSRHTWRNIVENLNDETALLTLDWAQKLEPQYHRESQKSFEVLAILDDVVAELKKMGVKKFIARSDNAGCYRSTEIIMGLRKIEEKNDVKIIRWTFSEVQAGKSSCDRKAGVVKSRVEEYVSQKNDVATANQFFQALTTPYDIPYMTITQASIKPSGKAKVAGFPNIQLYTDYTILDDGVIAYKATNIGKGLKISNEKYKDKIEIANMEVKIWTSPSAGGDVTKNTEASFISRGQKAKFWNTIRDPLVQRKSVEDPKAFPCPEESCEEKFLTVEELEAHIETGNHTVREPESLTLRDRALKLYQQCANELLEETNELSAAQLTFSNVNDEISDESDFFEGNALRTGKKKCNSITEKARNFIKKLYDQGEKDSSQKISHEKAVEMMEAAKDPKDPSLPLFRATELLTSQQINGLFTRFKKGSASTTDKKRKHEEDEENFDENNCDDGEEDDDEGEEEEATPPAKRPRRVTRRRGLKNRLQAEEEREIEEIRTEARRAALETF